MLKNSIFILFAFISLNTFAQMLQISDHDLINTSEKIVRGTILASESKWVNNHQYIYTFTKVKVEEVISGQCTLGDTITIVTPGGYDPITDMSLTISHQAEFKVGEEAVLFLVEAKGDIDAIDYTFLKHEPNIPSNTLRVNGYFQGKRKIIFDKKLNQKMILKPNENRTVPLEAHNKNLKKELNHLHKR